MLGVRLTVAIIVGALISTMLAPLIDWLNASVFVGQVIGQGLQEIIAWGGGLIVAVALARADRVEAFLERHLVPASLGVGICLLAALVISSGAGLSVGLLVLGPANVVAAALFTSFCGFFVYQGMYRVSNDQEGEYRKRRDGEVEQLKEMSVAEGDPALAAGYLGLHTAGALGEALGMIIVLVFGTAFFAAVFFALALANALYLYDLTWPEALFCGGLFAAGSIGLVAIALQTGADLAPQVHLDRKYRAVLPDPGPP